MNQTDQQVLVSRIAKLIHQLAPLARKFRIQISDDARPGKAASTAKCVECQRAGIIICQSKVRSHRADEKGVQESLLSPAEFMAAFFQERMRLQPAGRHHVIENPHE